VFIYPASAAKHNKRMWNVESYKRTSVKRMLKQPEYRLIRNME